MNNAGRLARVTVLTMAALAMTGGIAGAAAKGNSPAVHGTVTAVNGDMTPGACGTANVGGAFTLTTTNSSTTPPTVVATTVDVSTATSFVEHKVTSPSFADVCVGDTSVVIGTDVDFTLAADAVTIHAPKPPPKVHLFGSVTAVNGDPTTGACGTSGATGAFTLSNVIAGTTVTTTVDVDGSTIFTERKMTGTSFADVCVGDRAVALGPESGGVLDAALVAVKVPRPPRPPKPLHVSGIVASVDGVATAGTCGTAGAAGTFTVTSTDNSTTPPTTITRTVNVTAGTSFAEKNVSPASFADVCFGGKAVSIGTSTNGALDAIAVAAYAPKVPRG